MTADEIIQLATSYLKEAYGKDAEFKKDQCESIVSTITNQLTLVVQKTGWGKSLVYFISTKFFRQKGYGPTIIVSPLLSLMRNQQEACQRMGLSCCLINHTSPLKEVRYSIINDSYDLIFITPEQLNKSETRNTLVQLKKELALFVVDEAHCISEWGHDFRPDYCQIKDFVINTLSNPKMHILATTATANDAVIHDLEEQLSVTGAKLNIIRGELIRHSLYLEVVKNLKKEEKFAWILSYLQNDKNVGAGIIYCATIRDTDILAKYLQYHGIYAVSYHSNTVDRNQVEFDFYSNKIKVLVATSALGMGYDKPDISFIIHMQSPISMLEYYQQIGRAGRGIEKAYIFLLSGPGDEKLSKYFIESSFPDPFIMNEILNYMENNNYVRMSDILNEFNLRRGNVEAILKHLTARKLISKTSSCYTRTLKASDLDEYIAEKKQIIELKHHQNENMQNFINYDGCLMEYVSKELDDPFSKVCGRCCNCTGIHTNVTLTNEIIVDSSKFINCSYTYDINLNLIKHKVKFPDNTNICNRYKLLNNDGFYLTKYNFGLGEIVARDKYENGEFSSLLVQNMANMILFLAKNGYIVNNNVIVTYVPSLRHPSLVREFAYRVANSLSLPFVDAIIKVNDNEPQKTMQNSAKQLNNVINAFAVNNNCKSFISNKNIFLIDDMVDSGWTFTWCGIILGECNVQSVTPFALANTSPAT